MNRVQDLAHQLITQYRDLKPVYCPALAQEVHFTMRGWRHVLGVEHRGRARGSKQVRERLSLIFDYYQQLAKLHHVDQYREQQGKKYYGLRFRSSLDGSMIRIIILQGHQGVHEFYSIFREY